MRLCSRAQYLSGSVPQMRPADYNATLLVQAVKGLPISDRQYADVFIGGKRTRIDHKNPDRAIDWFAEWAAGQLTGAGPKVLIPVPSSATLTGSAPNFRTALLANAIAKASSKKVIVAPIIRFKAKMLPCRSGGSRNPQDIYRNLVTVGDIPAGEIVLVDDVVTSSAHFKAVAWELDDSGVEPVLAIACGRTMHCQLDNPFAVPDEGIELDRP